MSDAEVAARFGLRRAGSGNWRGTCPVCGYVDGVSVRSIATGRSRLRCFAGCQQDELDACLLREGWTPPAPPNRATATSSPTASRDAAARLWAGSDPALGSIVAAYGLVRGVPALARSAAIRFRLDTPHPESAGRYPAMIAAVVDVAGELIGAHRTYLRPDGMGKATLDPPRASLGPLWGGAVRLDPVAAEMVVAEGIETAAAAAVLVGLPAWSAVSAGNLASGLQLPEQVRAVMIAADHDKPGLRAADAAAARWRAEGRVVRIAVPDRPGADFADVVVARAHG